jgi:hypothetical protein
MSRVLLSLVAPILILSASPAQAQGNKKGSMPYRNSKGQIVVPKTKIPDEPTAPKNTKATDEKLSEGQATGKLQATLASLKQGVAPSQNAKDTIQKNLEDVIPGDSKPDGEKMKQLSSDLSVAISKSNINRAKAADLGLALKAALNPESTQPKVSQAIADAQKILKSSGVGVKETAAVRKSLTAAVEKPKSE